MNDSMFFPVNVTTPYVIGFNHARNGLEKVMNGNIKGLNETILGILECIPLVNYPIASFERKYRLAGLSRKMNERKIELDKEINNDSTKLQQIYFETHNSALSGRVKTNSSMYKLLDFSYPDRQLAILIRDLKEFKTLFKGKSEYNILENQIALLQKMEPIANAVTCLMLDPSKSGRAALQEKVIEIVTRLVQELKEGEIMLLPFGYTDADVYNLHGGGSLGHITLLELRHTEKNNCDARIFNSGEGADLHQHLDTRIYPFEILKLPFNEISKKSFWNDLIQEITGEKKGSLSEGYKRLQGLIPKTILQDPAMSKAYRTQIINHCPKKSLQIWLHENLNKHVELYQKFRIFALEKRLNEIDDILQRHSEANLSVDHAIALWGGSDRVSSLAFKYFYQARGFFSGPHVKGSIPRNDLIALKAYSQKLLKSRQARLMLLENNISGAIALIKTLPLLQAIDIIINLEKFSEKMGLDPNLLQAAKKLNQVEINFLMSEKGMQEIIKEKNLEDFGPNAHLFAKKALTKIMFNFNEEEQTFLVLKEMPNVEFKAFVILDLLSIALKRNQDISKLSDELEKVIKSLTEGETVYIWGEFAKVFFPYDRSKCFAALDKADIAKEDTINVLIRDLYSYNVDLAVYLAKRSNKIIPLYTILKLLAENKKQNKEIEVLFFNLVKNLPTEEQTTFQKAYEDNVKALF